jgi:hypothetical protein
MYDNAWVCLTAKAESLYRRALATREKMLGAEDPSFNATNFRHPRTENAGFLTDLGLSITIGCEASH